jgi:hypothetical protein
MINTKLQSIIDTKSAIGNAIVNKGGTITGATPFFNYAAEINNISTGSVLTGNATTGDVLNGFTFYNNDANTIQTGTLTLTGNAVASEVFSGKTFYNNNAKSQLTGTFVFDGNAVTADVSTGKTFFATNGTKLTGNGTLLNQTFDINLSTNVVGGLIGGYNVVSNNGAYFAVGLGTSNQIRKYHINSVLIANTAAMSTQFIVMHINNGFLYASLNGNTLVKYHESNLALVGTGVNYAADIYSITTNDSFVYMVGSTASGINRSVVKMHDSNLALVGNTANYGQIARNVIVNDGFIYVGGYANLITRYFDSNLAFSLNSSGFGARIEGMVLKDNFIYVGGVELVGTNRGVSKYHLGNLTISANSTNTGNLNNIVFDETYVYVLTKTSVVRKLYQSNLSFVGNQQVQGTQGLSYNNNFLFASSSLLFANTPIVNINNSNFTLIIR